MRTEERGWIHEARGGQAREGAHHEDGRQEGGPPGSGLASIEFPGKGRTRYLRRASPRARRVHVQHVRLEARRRSERSGRIGDREGRFGRVSDRACLVQRAAEFFPMRGSSD